MPFARESAQQRRQLVILNLIELEEYLELEMQDYFSPKLEISFERASELFSYDSETGAITKRLNGKVLKPQATGYVRVTVDGERIYGHHLAWLLYYGTAPESMLDHKDRNRSNNAIQNLRYANTALNKLNTSKCRGRYKLRGVVRESEFCYRAQVGKRVVGYFNTASDAAFARDDYVIEHFGRDAAVLNFECEELRAKHEFGGLLMRALLETDDHEPIYALRDQGLFKTPKLAIPAFKALLDAHSTIAN